jgi:hypothetical protein
MVAPHSDGEGTEEVSYHQLEVGFLIPSLFFGDALHLSKYRGRHRAGKYSGFQFLDRDRRRHWRGVQEFKKLQEFRRSPEKPTTILFL